MQDRTASEKLTIFGHLSKKLLAAFGWRFEYVRPPVKKGVVIVYPHTSNWDFILGVLARSILNLRMPWVGKHTLFKWPFEWFMRALGGVPVNRSSTHGMVEQLQQEYDRYDQIFITITPEGTRSKTDYWKSGFYHIAYGLKVPVGLAAFDYSRKTIFLNHWITLTGDREKDLEAIREAYKGVLGRRPELQGPIKFRD